MELTEHAVKVEELKGTLRKLISENPDSPEADKWRQQLQDIGSGNKRLLPCTSVTSDTLPVAFGMNIHLLELRFA